MRHLQFCPQLQDFAISCIANCIFTFLGTLELGDGQVQLLGKIGPLDLTALSLLPKFFVGVIGVVLPIVPGLGDDR